MKTQDLQLSYIEAYFELSSMRFFGSFMPAVSKMKNGGYRIRVLKSETKTYGHQTQVEYEYFETDKDGLVLSSPRGCAKKFNNKVIITDLEKRLPEFSEKKTGLVK